MKIDIVNFARHAKPKELRYMVGSQFPKWIIIMLRQKREGVDPAVLIDQLAEVCNVTEETKVLE